VVHSIRSADHRLERHTVPNVQAMELNAGPYLFEIVFVSRKQAVDHFHFTVRLIQKRADQR